MQLPEQENDKKIEEYAKTSLIGGILLVIMGFGFGFVNLALILMTVVTGALALMRNKGQVKKVTNFSLIGIGLIVVAFILSFILPKAPIDYIVADILIPSLNKIFFNK